jgi:hypothetical protein
MTRIAKLLLQRALIEQNERKARSQRAVATND